MSRLEVPKIGVVLRVRRLEQILDRPGKKSHVHIRGLENVSAEEARAHLAAGGRFVRYEYCISLVILTKRPLSDPVSLRPGELGLLRGLPYTALSLLLGWWGIPWGIIYTPLAIVTNCSGGHDITPEVRLALAEASPHRSPNSGNS